MGDAEGRQGNRRLMALAPTFCTLSSRGGDYMAPPNNPQVCKAALVYSHDTRQFVNTVHFRRLSAWTEANMLTLGTAIQQWWETYLRTVCPPVTALTQIQMRVYDPAFPLAVDIPVSPPSPGTAAGAPLPGSITSTISWRSGLAGRRYRGRLYVPGYNEQSVSDDDRLVSTIVAGLAQAALQFLAMANNQGVDPVVFHRDTNLYNLITSYIIENLVDSQRRRLPGRGR